MSSEWLAKLAMSKAERAHWQEGELGPGVAERKTTLPEKEVGVTCHSNQRPSAVSSTP